MLFTTNQMLISVIITFALTLLLCHLGILDSANYTKENKSKKLNKIFTSLIYDGSVDGVDKSELVKAFKQADTITLSYYDSFTKTRVSVCRINFLGIIFCEPSIIRKVYWYDYYKKFNFKSRDEYRQSAHLVLEEVVLLSRELFATREYVKDISLDFTNNVFETK